MQLAHAQPGGVVERQAHAVLELPDPARIGGDAALARGPVAGRQVVQHQAQIMARQPFGDLVGVKRIWKQELDSVETGGARGGEAVEEVQFREHEAEVGGKLWHAAILV